MNPPRTIPPVHVLIAAVFAAAAPWVFPRLSYSSGAALWVGAAVFAAGVVLVVRTRHLMVARGTTHKFEPTTLLIEDGVFRRSRNPMYIGMTAILLGAALALQNAASLAAPVYFFLVIDRVFVPFEEAKLEREIGEPYAAYRRRVRRWL